MANLRQEGYWDSHYEEELRNFEDHGDEGDVWFGEPLTRRIVNRLLHEIEKQFKQDDESNQPLPELSLVDVGCGNAFLLCTLIEKAKETTGAELLSRLRLLGIDYSENSIELSKKIFESKNYQDSKPNIQVKKCNFLDLNQVQGLLDSTGNHFDFIVDKGTFDAICLLSGDSSKNDVQSKYMQSIYALKKPGTIYILASCNHTEEELLPVLDKCAGTQHPYVLLYRIETPKIKFGGKEGSQICCLVIKFT